ncbi:TlpA family protein disulfide reductase [Actinoplanes sp. GCM10030250]|uniref:TlpA family protein disulfide reductase n=1 Tax=Actinoplanes sp. GCM10030250 TaxID=3273376 RepID=UPI003609159F
MISGRRRHAFRVPLLLGVLLAAALAATGCTTLHQPSAAGPVAATEKAAGTPVALTFTGKTLDGAAFDAASLAGKPALLWFWAPWCATCASEAQSVADLYDEYSDRLGILGIGGLGTTEAMHEFVRDLEVEKVPHLDDAAGKIWQRFGIAQQSWYVMIDPAGSIVYRGYLDDLQLTEKVRTLTA